MSDPTKWCLERKAGVWPVNGRALPAAEGAALIYFKDILKELGNDGTAWDTTQGFDDFI